MTKHNTASFLALADLSETLAIVALDELVRRKDGDAMDSFMAAAIIDREAFSHFLAHEPLSFTRTKAAVGEPGIANNTGFDLLLRPIQTSVKQPDLDAWQLDRLEKAIAFGLAMPNPSRWMTAVANHPNNPRGPRPSKLVA